MRMLRRPGQHRQRDAEIIMLTRRTGIDDTALLIFDSQLRKLLIGALNVVIVVKANLFGL